MALPVPPLRPPIDPPGAWPVPPLPPPIERPGAWLIQPDYPDDPTRARRLDWAKLFQRAWAVDVLVCPRCKGRMRLITSGGNARGISAAAAFGTAM